MLATGLIAGMVVRIVVGVLLVRRGGGLEGAFVAMVWGEVVTAVIVLVGLREMLRHPEMLVSGLATAAAAPAPGAPGLALDAPDEASAAAAGGSGSSRLLWGHARLAGAAFTGYWILTTIDVVLARHWLGREVSGWYSAAATIAQIALLAPGGIAALTFPRLVGSDIPRLVGPDSKPNQRLMFALGSAAVALTGFVAAVVVCVFAHGTVRALFGLRYSPAASVVGLLSFSSALLGLVTVLLHYHLNRGGRVTVNLCWPAIVIVIVGTSIWHHSMTEIATVMVLGLSLIHI